MGSTKRPPDKVLEETVDLDADTVESPEDIFCNDETEESPHKIILRYEPNTPKPIIDHFPTSPIRKQIGVEVMLGRHKTSDVLMYEPHMARSFAAITCRTTAARKIRVVLRNACDASKQKRITVISPSGEKSDILPTHEVELVEKTTFKLECVTFAVEIELGDLNARTYELEVRPHEKKKQLEENPAFSDPVPISGASGGGAHIGLSVRKSIESQMFASDQVIPKVIPPTMSAVPGHAAGGYGQGYGPGIQHPGYQGYGVAQYMPQVSPQNYLTGVHYSISPVQHNIGMQQHVGYCEIQQPYSVIQHAVPVPQMRHSPPPGYTGQQQLLERGGGYDPSHYAGEDRAGQGITPSQRISMSELAQALAHTQASSPPPVQSTKSIIAHPSTQDRNPALYPSPAQPRMRFPPPDGLQSPVNLSDLPRGPPLGSLTPAQSINLHPHVMTTHVVPGTTEGTKKENKLKREPTEHDEK